MPQPYFARFPKISYANVECRDLTKRVRIDQSIKTNIDLYYPAELQAGFRADQLADAYYEDSTLDWMIYLMNDIVDPYYHWYISEIDFEEYLITKYESVANSQERIAYYRNNWASDDNQITPEAYENTLNLDWRKYYEPVFTPTNKVYAYKRKELDWLTNTNRILQYTISYANSEVTFANDEIVDIKDGGEIVGGGTVIVSNSTTLTIHHVSGNTSANTTATKDIIGETSGANGTANAVVTLSENFDSVEEARFWSAVSLYDVELEHWESLKTVDVMNPDLIDPVSESVTEKLRET